MRLTSLALLLLLLPLSCNRAPQQECGNLLDEPCALGTVCGPDGFCIQDTRIVPGGEGEGEPLPDDCGSFGSTFDPARAYVWGSLVPGDCTQTAFTDVVDPVDFTFGVSCDARPRAQVRSDGDLVYLHGDGAEAGLRIFRADGEVANDDPGVCTPPVDVEDNERTLPTPAACPVEDFALQSGGLGYVFFCAGGWTDDTFATVAGVADVHAYGPAGLLLAADDDGALVVRPVAPGGVSVPVASPAAASVLSARAVDDTRFRAVLSIDGARVLAEIDDAGAYSEIGTYPAAEISGELLVGDDVLGVTTAGTVSRLSTNGSVTVAFDEALGPVKLSGGLFSG